MKKIKLIPNTIMNISVLKFFDVYISDGLKIALSTHRLGNI